MQILSGVVSELSFSTVVSGDKHHTGSKNVALFELDGQPVELIFGDSIFIRDGDEAIVAGGVIGGIFRALAYNNTTRGVKNKHSTAPYWIGGAALCATVVFLPFGVWCFFKARRYDRAFKAIGL